MEKQILKMLEEIQKEQKEFREETRASFSDANNRLDRIEKRLDGAGYQFEQVRVKDLNKRLTTVESDMYRMTR
ncbi:hypothetical protein [Bacillus pseudomycoides]|uniref:hypothetical protein n=1 Tax=Bacillus pseudomycoides TaxID=64104 RepID=UPI000BEF47E6|nr:hypothetical protein [Bacillus pseudomycoides]PEJ37273.1 hypothetical protein CN677_09490 [Bacillus pseudomycoides]PHA98376.1 hypothetical protein COE78_01995 [Bacillus pseudomycoides]PHC78279.1 hypothetical protein COF38_07210 [Bacillus pseudomycoides]